MSGAKIVGLNYWWNLSAICLVYFAICSAYFTDLKYGNGFDVKKFWRNKIYRLGIKVFFVNLFLLCLFLILKKDNIFNIYSLVNIFGFTGVLNWFKIPNDSPFGAGLWFLTLLYIFYFAYPLLMSINRSYLRHAFALFAIIFFVFLDRYINVGHTLWLTAAGFIAGIYLSKKDVNLSAVQCFVLLSMLVVGFITLNLFSVKLFNGLLILAIGIMCFVCTQVNDVSESFLSRLSYLDSFVLEIFMLHTYLFVYPTSVFFIDFLITTVLIIFSSFLISTISGYFINFFRAKNL